MSGFSTGRVLMRFLALAAPMAVAAPRAAMAQVPGQADSARSLEVRLDAYLRPYIAANNFAGVVLVARNDSVLVRRAYGYRDISRRSPNLVSTRFPLASISKTFTAAAIIMLAREGKLKLGDSIAKYIPEYPEAAGATIEQLLTHHSGIPTVDDPDVYLRGVPYSELIRRMRLRPLDFPPGTAESYASQTYSLLALIIERVSHLSYEQFIRERIFRPAGMTASGDMRTTPNYAGRPTAYQAGAPGHAPFRLEANEVPDIGGGSLYASADDLLRWLNTVRHGKLFPMDSLRYPYGWGNRTYGGHKLIEQSGLLEGYNTYMALYPHDGLSVVFLTNIQSGQFEGIGQDFEALVFGGKVSQPPQVAAVPLATASLASYTAAYRSKDFPLPMNLILSNGALALRWGTYPFSRPLVPLGHDRFFYPSEYAQVRFERDAAGRIVRTIWTWGSGDAHTLTRDSVVP